MGEVGDRPGAARDASSSSFLTFRAPAGCHGAPFWVGEWTVDRSADVMALVFRDSEERCEGNAEGRVDEEDCVVEEESRGSKRLWFAGGLRG